MSAGRRTINPDAARRIRFSLVGWLSGTLVLAIIAAADHGFRVAAETVGAFAIGGGLVTTLMILAALDPPWEPDPDPSPPQSPSTD
jgi:hypothetical protein